MEKRAFQLVKMLCLKVMSALKEIADLLYKLIFLMLNAEELKKDLDTLQRWEQTSFMEFNLDKCEVNNISNER